MREVNARKVVIAMVDGTVFNGMINIGNTRRVSDFIKKAESPFIVIFDAERESNGHKISKDVYFLNLDHILWMQPEDLIEGVSQGQASSFAI